MTGDRGTGYDRAAWFYDAAAEVYSFGRIRRAKRAQVRRLKPGERVLFLGVGAGDEAVRAAALGAVVSCIDISPAMLQILRRKLEQKRLKAELIVGDVLEHRPAAGYDAVAANFLFNVFDHERMLTFLEHAARLVAPGGRLMIADIAPPTGSLLARWFVRFYARLGMAPFWLGGLVAWHAIHDYAAYFSRFELTTEAVEDFRLFRLGPVMFRVLIARKNPRT